MCLQKYSCIRCQVLNTLTPPLKKIVIVYIKNIERISEFLSNIVESFQKYFFPYPNNVTSQDIIAFSPLPYQE